MENRVEPKAATHTAHAEDIAKGRWLFAQGCSFYRGVVSLDAMPFADCVEFAFAGRSNVGKSSLINVITGHKNLARTSNTPGRTQEINFFTLNAKASRHMDSDTSPCGFLVDLPGYGYARESKNKIAAWNNLLKRYLSTRAELRRVFLLIDARHGLKKNDTIMMDNLDAAGVSYQIITTKADKLTKDALEKSTATLHATLTRHVAAFSHIINTSTVKNIGIDDLRATIAGLVDLESLGYKAKNATGYENHKA